MAAPPTLVITGTPHIHARQSTAGLAWSAVACLLPAGAWGVYVFGPASFLVLLTAVVSSVLAEAVMSLAFKRFSLFDGTAVLTGLLVGFGMSPAVPLYVPAAASVFAIVVVKWTFGGLGSNWMNPALGGRLFASFSWGGAMSVWTVPRTLAGAGGIDGSSAATPLGLAKSLLQSSPDAVAPFSLIGTGAASGADSSLTSWLNLNFLNPLGAQLPGGYFDLLLGNVAGCIGEVSAVLLLLGAAYLIARDIIAWKIPAAYLGTFILLSWACGGLPFGTGFFTGDALFALLSGGVILGAFYMATDPVTSPLCAKGMVIFGIGCGALNFAVRFFGSQPEGTAFAIVLMNMFVPVIDRLTSPARLSRKATARKGGEA
jgi:Na+-translocating ferredoxin:NAD+ oxidoreductase subunit D